MEECLDFFNRYIMGSVQMLAGFYFFARFLKTKVKRTHYILFAVFGIAMMTAVPAGSLAEFPAYVLLLMTGGILACQADIMTSAVYAVVTAEMMRLCYGIWNSALCMLDFLIGPPDREISGILFMALGELALPAAAFCSWMLERHALARETVKNKCALMILAPALMIVLVGQYIGSVIYGNVIITDGGGNIVNMNANHGQMLAIQMLGMAGLFSLMFSYKNLLDHFRLNMEFSLLKQEEHFLNQYVEEAKERYAKTKSFRHDIKNHITVVKELLRGGKPDQALHYVGDMEFMTEELSFPCSTNHPAVDILVGNKLGMAGRYGIDVYCVFELPNQCLVRDIDFCIILSNALDNAICACQNMKSGAKKYICLTSMMQGDFLVLEIENSFEGKGVIRRGTGLSNIKAAAEKYQGSISVKAQDHVFSLSVLLVIPQHSESIPLQIR